MWGFMINVDLTDLFMVKHSTPDCTATEYVQISGQ
jgi:hypothetical protein